MKIAFSDFWHGFNPSTFSMIQMIHSIIDIQETKDINEADYLLFSCMGNRHWFVPDNCVKIFYTGENITPDFNTCDYAIGFDVLEFGDRYLRFPLYYLCDNICEQMEIKHLCDYDEIIKKKSKFCSITVSNSKRNPIFKELYDQLSIYKEVDSGGKWNNTIGGPIDDKYLFDMGHKFSIVCENSATPGYTTEKIVEAFAANCIPIYWGDPLIGKVFNQKAFINVSEFNSIKDVVEKVKEIDGNDDLYREMLLEPALAEQKYSKDNQMKILKSFLTRIFGVSPEQANRRNRDFQGTIYIETRKKQIEKGVNTAFLSRIIKKITCI